MTDEPTTLEEWLERLAAVPCVTVEREETLVKVTIAPEFLKENFPRGGYVKIEDDFQRRMAGRKLWRSTARTLHESAVDRERWRQYFPFEFSNEDGLEQMRKEEDEAASHE